MHVIGLFWHLRSNQVSSFKPICICHNPTSPPLPPNPVFNKFQLTVSVVFSCNTPGNSLFSTCLVAHHMWRHFRPPKSQKTHDIIGFHCVTAETQLAQSSLKVGTSQFWYNLSEWCPNSEQCITFQMWQLKPIPDRRYSHIAHNLPKRWFLRIILSSSSGKYEHSSPKQPAEAIRVAS